MYNNAVFPEEANPSERYKTSKMVDFNEQIAKSVTPQNSGFSMRQGADNIFMHS